MPAKNRGPGPPAGQVVPGSVVGPGAGAAPGFIVRESKWGLLLRARNQRKRKPKIVQLDGYTRDYEHRAKDLQEMRRQLISIRPISEREFEDADSLCRVIVHDDARKFASGPFPGASHCLVMSWRSDLIDPVLAPTPSGSVFWIGVDQHVVALGLSRHGLVLDRARQHAIGYQAFRSLHRDRVRRRGDRRQ